MTALNRQNVELYAQYVLYTTVYTRTCEHYIVHSAHEHPGARIYKAGETPGGYIAHCAMRMCGPSTVPLDKVLKWPE